MSFQDFGRGGGANRGGNNSRAGGGGAGNNAAAISSSSPAVSPTPPSSGNSAGAGSQDDGLGQISESLLQYQRNVGILEKIVQSLMARSNSGGGSGYAASSNAAAVNELEMQFKAQVDVLAQLQDRVAKQVQQQKKVIMNAANRGGTNQATTALIKLQRDFERVQSRAANLQDSVQRLRRQQQAANAKKASSSSASGSGARQMQDGAGADYHERLQLQLQEDRLHEEIMREREQEIRNINRGMHQVNEIYKDLAHIVGSQQEQVDSIETQMDEARANAESGLQQVEKANEKFGAGPQCIIS